MHFLCSWKQRVDRPAGTTRIEGKIVSVTKTHTLSKCHRRCNSEFKFVKQRLGVVFERGAAQVSIASLFGASFSLIGKIKRCKFRVQAIRRDVEGKV
jgi:hypothetical protein